MTALQETIIRKENKPKHNFLSNYEDPLIGKEIVIDKFPRNTFVIKFYQGKIHQRRH